jgi:hypothetical protein
MTESEMSDEQEDIAAEIERQFRERLTNDLITVTALGLDAHAEHLETIAERFERKDAEMSDELMNGEPEAAPNINMSANLSPDDYAESDDDHCIEFNITAAPLSDEQRRRYPNLVNVWWALGEDDLDDQNEDDGEDNPADDLR